MKSEIFSKNITTAVRTPRFAVLLEDRRGYWKTYVHGIVQSFSQAWGGEHFIIIPTDGKSIDRVFWKILEAYSPDYIGRYIPSLLDMEEADPGEYKRIKDHYKQSWNLPNDQFEETWTNQAESVHLGGLDVDGNLAMELKNRLSPFHFSDHIVSQNVSRNTSLGFPFTGIDHIIESAIDRPTSAIYPATIDDDSYRLLALSRAGALSSEYANMLSNKGVTITHLPDYSKSFRLKDYICALESGTYDPRWRQLVTDSSNDDHPEESFMTNLPYALSMLHLRKYYRQRTHKEWKENKSVVIGDTLADYCLYYCLSRMHEGVFWLPDTHLTAAHQKILTNKRRGASEEPVRFTENEDIATALINEYFKAIDYGHHEKRIKITSTSLSTHQLSYRKRWMSEMCFSGEFRVNCDITPIEEVPVDCVMEVIELNNHANQQDMVFQNRKSIGRLNTPKPKNFKQINPAEHRWITSVNIDGFHPPALPFLGSQVIRLRESTHETRAAKNELAYFCPNIGYFGGDIDVNMVRPSIELIPDEVIFSSYFVYSGYTTELSDKGSFLKDTVDRFGSLEQTAAFFRDESKRKLFDQYLWSKPDPDDDEIVYLSSEKRAYLSFKAFERKLGSQKDAIGAIDTLIDKRIVTRGLIFQCARCRKSAWYDIAAISDSFVCTRCGLSQPYRYVNWKSPAEPKWYYRLAETVYLFYDSSSHLTVLALDKLRQESPYDFHYVSETNIVRPESSKPKQEIDILAIVNGDIILGECKDCPVKTSDIKKYLAIFSQLNIQPAQFLLATTEQNVNTNVQTELNKFASHRLFTRSDLYG